MRKPNPWTTEKFCIPEFEPIFGTDEPFAENLSRNVIFIGETGSGKTTSGIKPSLKSMIRYESENVDKRCAVLLIDPKHELQSVVDFEVSDSKRIISCNNNGFKRIDFFADDRGQITPTEAFNIALNFLSPSNQAGGQKYDIYWYNSSKLLTETLIELVACIEITGQSL